MIIMDYTGVYYEKRRSTLDFYQRGGKRFHVLRSMIARVAFFTGQRNNGGAAEVDKRKKRNQW
jgi:hypothetical protein